MARASASFLGIICALLLGEGGLRLEAWRQDARAWKLWRSETPPRPAEGSSVPLARILRPHPDPHLVYDLVPNLRSVHVQGVGSVVSTNGAGFRDSEHTVERAPRTIRIVGLGDSVVFGWGVGQREDLVAQLGGILRAEYAQAAWETINTGVPGYNTTMELSTLREKALRYAPDLVLIVFVANDLGLPSFILDEDGPWSPDHSQVLDLVRGLVGPPSRRGDMRPAPHRLTWAPHPEGRQAGTRETDPTLVPARYRDMVGFDAFERELDDLADLSREHGFEVAALAFYDYDPLGRMLARASELGFTTALVRPRLAAYLEERGIEDYHNSELVVSDRDPHPSVIGHRLAAEALRDALAADGTLERLVRRVEPREGAGGPVVSPPPSSPRR